MDENAMRGLYASCGQGKSSGLPTPLKNR